MFPSSFKPNPSINVSSKTSTIVSLVLIIFGYSLSAVTAVMRSSPIFQLDILLMPCLTSCLLGLFNVLYNLGIREHPEQTSPAVVAIAISAASTVVYGVAALWTFRNIYMVKARDRMHRHHPDASTDILSETEQQRQQLSHLLLQRECARHGSTDTNQATFRIGLPQSSDRPSSRSTLDTLRHLPRVARNAYERTNSMYGRQDYTEALAPPMDSVAEEAPSDPRIAPLPATAFVPPQSNYNDTYIPGIVNTRSYTPQEASPVASLPKLQENGYPLEKPPPLNEQHPLQRAENRYHIVEDHQPTIELLMARHEQSMSASRASTQSREIRRMEIELADRGKHRDKGLRREDLDGIEIAPSIKRVGTDGWASQMMSNDH